MTAISSSRAIHLLGVLLVLAQQLYGCRSFNLAPPQSSTTISFGRSSSSSSPSLLSSSRLWASKGAKGFGKTPDPPTPPSSSQPKKSTASAAQSSPSNTMTAASQASSSSSSTGLTSIPGGSTANPIMPQSVVDPTKPVEDRTTSILRDKYGLRTREEQLAEERRLEVAKEQRQKLEEWRRLADKGEDFDLIKILPDPLLIFIDRFLKVGVAVCTALFISAGIAITVEAGSKATNNPLPTSIDDFITNVVEPNFTPGLLVLLGFSVSLGAFAALQLSSSSSTYRESNDR